MNLCIFLFIIVCSLSPEIAAGEGKLTIGDEKPERVDINLFFDLPLDMQQRLVFQSGFDRRLLYALLSKSTADILDWLDDPFRSAFLVDAIQESVEHGDAKLFIRLLTLDPKKYQF